MLITLAHKLIRFSISIHFFLYALPTAFIDLNHYFQNVIDVKCDDTGTAQDYAHLECLYERTTNALESVDELISKLRVSDSEEIFGLLQSQHNQRAGAQIENTSYLDMSRKKYESIDLTKEVTENLSRHDYVDVVSKPLQAFTDDDNIYDNYVVERNHIAAATAAGKKTPSQNRTGNAAKEDTTVANGGGGGQKPDCPFNGLPAAHLTIMHSPKIGWLTMHLRGKRYIHHFGVHFKRKYYTGLVMKQCENARCEWWLLMYAGGTSDLKPSVCLLLNHFTVHATKEINRRQPEYENKCNPCKFELNEKTNRKNKKTYCFVADTSENCEHWVNLLKQLSIGLPYVESTFLMTAQIRKLPMLPLNAKHMDIDRQAIGMDTIDTNNVILNSRSTHRDDDDDEDICNHSEGVYEEPEDYYRNVQNYSMITTKKPILPLKKAGMENVHTAEIYDTPRKPIRTTNEHYDQIARLKDSAPVPGQMAKSDENGSGGKSHMSTMRKWLFSNHFTKLRHSSNSTNSERTSNGDGITEAATSAETAAAAVPPQSQHSQCHTTTSNVPPTDGQRRTFNIQPAKFNKVHMIINQLEANGQLTLISGGTSTKV